MRSAAVKGGATCSTALELLEGVEGRRLSFGCPVMDRALGGGVLPRGVSEVCVMPFPFPIPLCRRRRRRPTLGHPHPPTFLCRSR